MSDPGSVSTASCYFDSEHRYVEELSCALTSPSYGRDGADDSSCGKVEESSPTTMPCLQENRWLLQKRIQSKWETARAKPGQRGHHAALSVIRDIPDEVGAMIRENAPSLIEGIMDEMIEMRDDICKAISLASASTSVAQAHSFILETAKKLPELLQCKLDVHVADVQQKVADHVETVVHLLEGVLVDQGELAKIAHAVSEEVQEILREKVAACVQESFEYATHRMNVVLHSLGDVSGTQVSKPPFLRALVASRVLQAARDVVVETMEQARNKKVQAYVTSSLANEAVAQTLLRAKAGQPLDSADNFSENLSPIGANSCGSLGHPEMCSRPCIFFASRTCANGDSCGYCHLPHDVRTANLDKKGREQINGMTLEQRAVTLLPIVRQKAIRLRLHRDCVQTIDEIISSRSCRTQAGMSLAGQVHKGAYTKLTLRSLMGMLKANTDGESSELQTDLHHLACLLKSSCAALQA
eukprot:TRINITY_DN8138_c0_g3_i2.p1 TRINITY_DN8138_c0_g3~~TRINITY_DN8138_c0_g3_i2.p1  ORF type:complete len:507 (+),score=88.26 TRINITY_DN8138_c0_g3_i2:112-1521(+)